MKDYLRLLREAEHTAKFTGFTIEIPDCAETDAQTGEPAWKIYINGRSHRTPMEIDKCLWYLRGIIDAYQSNHQA